MRRMHRGPLGGLTKIIASSAILLAISCSPGGDVDTSSDKFLIYNLNTDTGDYEVKLRNLKRFLEHGDKAKVTVRFRGREMAHQDIGRRVLERVKEDLIELGTVEQFPKMEGRQMVMVISPKKKQ